MKTVNIKGKEYVQVNERIIYFRENYKGWRLTTELVSLEEGAAIMKAFIHNPVGELIATGYAREKDGDGFINKTSFIENCETSAWGRALGNLGIGVETSIASSEEVGNAVLQQEKKQTKSFGNVTEKDAIELARKKGLGDLLKSLEKPANVDYKVAVMKTVCEELKVAKWYDIQFTKDFSYQDLIFKVQAILKKEQDLANAGI